MSVKRAPAAPRARQTLHILKTFGTGNILVISSSIEEKGPDFHALLPLSAGCSMALRKKVVPPRSACWMNCYANKSFCS
jgi:hypothetical protein